MLRTPSIPSSDGAPLGPQPSVRNTSQRRRRRAGPPGEPRRVGYAYLAIPLAVYSAFVVVPVAATVVISLGRWRPGLRAPEWVGLGNFADLALDPVARESFQHAALLVVFYSFIPVVIGLAAAVLLTRRPIRGMTTFRTVLFLPYVMTTVVVALTWQWLYAADGVVNQALRWVGLGGVARPWLADFDLALPALGVVGTWTHVGLVTVLFMAAIQRIPAELYEAARIDGAGWLREQLAVTLPGLRNQLVVVITLTIIFGLRTFDLVFVATRGGPGTSTRVPALEIYQRAFLHDRIGSGAAIAVVLVALVLLISFTIVRLGEDRE